MHIPDTIERGEARCEDWASDAEQPDGRFKCCCGKLFKLEEGETLSPDPYAIPVCPDCAEAYFSKANAKGKAQPPKRVELPEPNTVLLEKEGEVVKIDSPLLKLGDNARLARGECDTEKWLELLPSGPRERALRQWDGQPSTASSLGCAIYCFAPFARTQEKKDYWQAVAKWCWFMGSLPEEPKAEGGVK